jgi:hypothetical protein
MKQNQVKGMIHEMKRWVVPLPRKIQNVWVFAGWLKMNCFFAFHKYEVTCFVQSDKKQVAFVEHKPLVWHYSLFNEHKQVFSLNQVIHLTCHEHVDDLFSIYCNYKY